MKNVKRSSLLESSCHLNGNLSNSGENSNETVHPGGVFSEKKENLLRYFLFLAFTGIPGNFCTICPHLPVPGFSLLFLFLVDTYPYRGLLLASETSH